MICPRKGYHLASFLIAGNCSHKCTITFNSYCYDVFDGANRAGRFKRQKN